MEFTNALKNSANLKVSALLILKVLRQKNCEKCEKGDEPLHTYSLRFVFCVP